MVPDLDEVREGWLEHVTPHLKASGLSIPTEDTPPASREEHTEHLTSLLDDLQKVARLEPDAVW